LSRRDSNRVYTYALPPLLFNFALEHASKKMQDNQVGLKLYGTHQLLAYTYDANLLRCNIHAIEKNMGTSIDANKVNDLEMKSKN
jgi:hypothetical protein